MRDRHSIDAPVLVLGGSGFLGRHVVRSLVASGARVYAASRVPWTEEGEAVVCDASEPGAAEALLRSLEPRAVLLCAAMARAGDCEREPEAARRLNVELPGEVARATRAAGVRLVHVSTDLVYGASVPGPSGFAEEDTPGPLHTYGRSKAAGERAVLEADPDAVVARLPLLFGDSDGRGLGASDQLLHALERGQAPLLFTDEWRTPLEVGDAAKALVELAGVEVRGLLHVAGPDRMTRYELGLLVLRSAGRGPEAIRAGTRAELGLERSRGKDCSLDASRARALLASPLRGPRAVFGADASRGSA